MKMSIKVVIFAIFLAFSLVFLASCHGSRGLDTFEMPEEFDENTTYNITFWSKNDNNQTQRDIYRKAVEDFQKIYPNIKVTIRSFYNYNDIYKEVLTNIQTGTTPNVCITYPDHIASYKTGANVVLPLDEIMADPEYGLGGSMVKFDSPSADEIVHKFLVEGQIDGQQYALPFMRSTEACYVNVDLVEALGFTMPEVLTWDFVFEVSMKAMEPVGVNENGEPIYINGQTIMVPFLYKSTDNMMIQMLRQKGYEYSTDDGDILLFNDDTKELLYMVADNVAAGSLTTFDIANAYPGDLLNAGRCIFGVDSTAGATWMGSDAPNYEIDSESIARFNMAVTEIPQFDTENPVMISQGPSICVFNKEDSGEVLASWLFAQYLLTNETQIAYSQTEGYVPVTLKAQNSPEYQDYLSREGEDNELYYHIKLKATKLLLNNMDNTFITPVFNGSASLRNAAGALIEETGKSVNRGIEITPTQLDNTFKRVESLYKLGEFTKDESGKSDLGKMPTISIALLSGIGVVWVGIGVYALCDYRKRRGASPKK